jgi:hypothetical protein
MQPAGGVVKAVGVNAARAARSWNVTNSAEPDRTARMQSGPAEPTLAAYFALGDALIALLIARIALKIASSLEKDATPAFVLFASSCAVHFHPVGLAVWTT